MLNIKNILSYLIVLYTSIVRKKGIVILEYHRISNNIRPEDVHSITPKEFHSQIKYLVNSGYSFVSLPEVIKKLSNGYDRKEKIIALTFDDGHKDILTYALPILEEFNVKATVFIVSNYVGKSGWLNKNGDLSKTKSNDDQWWDLLTWRDLREIKKQFWIEAHGMTHKRMSNLENDQLITELKDPVLKIKKELNLTSTIFCYPYGDFSKKTIEMVKKYGYDGACGTEKGVNFPLESKYWQLKRNEVGRGISCIQFRLLLTNGIIIYDQLSKISKRIRHFMKTS